ncbi:MAG TPA: TetR/AcrR family transcriptional regulator [Firmicutes bacterium]|nr:TetR/AcrR family transcriptional regulator [Bacillota bacterium]
MILKLKTIEASRLSDNMSTYERILEAAAALFAEYGYAETSMDRIAEKAEVAKGSIFYHFKNKDGLLVALVEVGFQLIYNEVDKPIAKQQPPLAQLTALMRKHFGMYLEYRSLARIIFSRTKYGISPEATARIEAIQQKYRQYIAAIIQRGINTGEFRPIPPWFAATVIMNQISGAAEAWLQQDELVESQDNPALPSSSSDREPSFPAASQTPATAPVRKMTRDEAIEQLLQMTLNGICRS